MSPSAGMRVDTRIAPPVNTTGAKVVDAELPAATLTVADCTTRPSISRSTLTLLAASAPRLLTPAVTATRSWFSERHALQRQRRDRQIGLRRRLHRDRREHAAGRQPERVVGLPPGALEVADEDRLLARQGRFREQARRELQGRRVAGGAGQTPAPDRSPRRRATRRRSTAARLRRWTRTAPARPGRASRPSRARCAPPAGPAPTCRPHPCCRSDRAAPPCRARRHRTPPAPSRA